MQNSNTNNGPEGGEISSNETKGNKAIEFFTYLAGEACPISVQQLIDFMGHVANQIVDGKPIRKSISEIIKKFRLPRKLLLNWMNDRHGITGDAHLFETLNLRFCEWLHLHPRYRRGDTTLAKLLVTCRYTAAEIYAWDAFDEMPFSTQHFVHLCGAIAGQEAAMGLDITLQFIRDHHLPEGEILQWLQRNDISHDFQIVVNIFIPLMEEYGEWTVGDSQDYAGGTRATGRRTR